LKDSLTYKGDTRSVSSHVVRFFIATLTMEVSYLTRKNDQIKSF